MDCSTDPTSRCETIKGKLFVARALENASVEFNIPLPILQAIAYTKSLYGFSTCDPSTVKIKRQDQKRLSVGEGGGHANIGEFAPMGLCDDEICSWSIFKAAQLINSTPEVLACDSKQNVRGGAALLASIAADQERNNGVRIGPELQSWISVVTNYSGFTDAESNKIFAARAFKTLISGATQDAVKIEPHPELESYVMDSFSEDVLTAAGLRKKNSLQQ
jgi:hypothetical protein